MFCSSCGTECLLSAKFCGHYGPQINDVTQNTTRKVDEGGASSGTSVPLTFKQKASWMIQLVLSPLCLILLFFLGIYHLLFVHYNNRKYYLQCVIFR